MCRQSVFRNYSGIGYHWNEVKYSVWCCGSYVVFRYVLSGKLRVESVAISMLGVSSSLRCCLRCGVPLWWRFQLGWTASDGVCFSLGIIVIDQ